MLSVSNARQMTRFELLLVLVTLGIVSAIAIPRMSSGADPSVESLLSTNLSVLRNALEQYCTEHRGSYPPAGSVSEALLGYSDETGTIFLSRRDVDRGMTFGPYLHAVPPMPVESPRKGSIGIGNSDAPGIGWIYLVNSAGIGEIRPNTTIERDSRGMLYAAY